MSTLALCAKRKAIGAVFIACAAMAGAEASAQGIAAPNMVKVAKVEGFCAHRDEGICAEWRFTRTPSLRLVADGDEDGMEYAFYQRDAAGKYQYILRIYPALRDTARGDRLFWGYTWDIADIVLEPVADPLQIQASFDHEVVDMGPIEDRPWQKRVPIVLFVGTTTQPDITVTAKEFHATTLPALVVQARRAPVRRP